jgi:RHS repeat-associated protein
MTFVDQSTATKWQISKSPFSAQPSIQKTIAGYPVMTVNSLGATNTFTYDGFARQISATTTRQASPDIGVIPLGTPSPSSAFVTQVTSNFYNNVGQLSSTVSDQLITNFEYDSIGRTHAVCSRGQQTSENSAITNTYNSLGQLIHQYGSTYPVAYEYDSQGRKTKMTTFADPNDPAETQWLYDEPTGLLTNKLYDDGTGPTYTYYPNGQMCSKTTAEGMIMSNAYNIAGQLISTTYSDGTPTITREYNRLGQLVTVNDAQGTRAFEYCTNTFALLSESINGTNVLMYSYNNRGQQTGYAFGNAEPQLGKIIIFDDYGRQSSISAIFGSETNTFHFNYLYGSSMVSSITNNLGFGVSKYYEDNRNLIVGISNYFGEDCISSFIYDNDALGRRTERLDFDENLLVKTNSFAYNGYQEINEADMGTNEYIFTYDDIGNRTEHLINDVYARYENNNDSLNRYSDTYSTDRVYNKGYDFDADGNMTNAIQYATPWDTWQYTWNAENRMTSARNTQYGIYVTYAYDYQGRMFEKVTNGSTNHFIWNGNHIIAEMTDSTTNSFVWSNGETLTASLDGETIFYCHDANKNVTDLVDDSGDIVVHYEYSPFGVQTTTDEQPLAETNPFGFSNEYFDATTGFIEYKYRIYLPALGKFLSLDPIEEQGGLNLYGIGGNDLINNWDNWGRSKAFYPFSGKIALLNRLAAEEQHVTKVYYSFREAFNASNQTEDWGALFIGSIKDVEMFTGNRGIDANSIVSESGKVYIYAHGSLDGNDIVTGGENIRPADIEWADASHFEPKTLKGIWAFSCYFGNKGGGAQQWHNILDVIVIGHEGLSKVTISPYIKFTDNVRKVDEMQKIYDEFKTLTTKVHSDQISYDSFYNLWEIMFDKWKEKGCIEKAYWHTFHPLGYKYNTYK